MEQIILALAFTFIFVQAIKMIISDSDILQGVIIIFFAIVLCPPDMALVAPGRPRSKSITNPQTDPQNSG